jgi:hypothetical protein
MPNMAEGFLWYLAFLFSVVVHEASHAFAALKLGDKTAYNGRTGYPGSSPAYQTGTVWHGGDADPVVFGGGDG